MKESQPILEIAYSLTSNENETFLRQVTSDSKPRFLLATIGLSLPAIIWLAFEGLYIAAIVDLLLLTLVLFVMRLKRQLLPESPKQTLRLFPTYIETQRADCTYRFSPSAEWKLLEVEGLQLFVQDDKPISSRFRDEYLTNNS